VPFDKSYPNRKDQRRPYWKSGSTTKRAVRMVTVPIARETGCIQTGSESRTQRSCIVTMDCQRKAINSKNQMYCREHPNYRPDSPPTNTCKTCHKLFRFYQSKPKTETP
jgi:hypothetical protein